MSYGCDVISTDLGGDFCPEAITGVAGPGQPTLGVAAIGVRSSTGLVCRRACSGTESIHQRDGRTQRLNKLTTVLSFTQEEGYVPSESSSANVCQTAFAI